MRKGILPFYRLKNTVKFTFSELKWNNTDFIGYNIYKRLTYTVQAVLFIYRKHVQTKFNFMQIYNRKCLFLATHWHYFSIKTLTFGNSCLRKASELYFFSVRYTILKHKYIFLQEQQKRQRDSTPSTYYRPLT